ncbi:helix-turn-helix transcriptional regulator [Vagococcus carniphilus]|uniref:Helix-turn-helix transcriptional regulator n=1 Tax=Vagococcus carniphilus TaxID=218144 RepID=A0AAW8U8J8_9ENTE|nr:helix-turn-helix transcriptional regulator [Vagococcus carniphilus]MDT2835126.1 helix-turn-helix transcriptional regulator [Vagococcus carniphilus]
MEKKILTNIPEGERDLRIIVWENIERFRKQKGVSVESFCEANAFPIRTYKRNLENNGASVSFPTIQKFAKYLGVNTISLFEYWSQ